MKELLRGKGTKSHMAEVPKRTPRANFTFTFTFRSWAGWRRSGLIQVQHENLLTGIDKNHEISRLYTLGPV
jgi:hypothetical protein